MNNVPCFGLWVSRKGITVRFFWMLFQIVRTESELFSQRNDKYRIRLFGWSVKLFGK